MLRGINTKYHNYYVLGSKAQIDLCLQSVNKKMSDEDIIVELNRVNLHEGFLPNIRKILDKVPGLEPLGEILYVVPLAYIEKSIHLFDRPVQNRITFATLPDLERIPHLNPRDVLACYYVAIAGAEIDLANRIENYLEKMFGISKSINYFNFLGFLNLSGEFDLGIVKKTNENDDDDDDDDDEEEDDEDLLSDFLEKESKTRHVISRMAALSLIAAHGRVYRITDFRELMREQCGIPYNYKELPYLTRIVLIKKVKHVMVHSLTLQFPEKIEPFKKSVTIFDTVINTMALPLNTLANKNILLAAGEEKAKEIINDLLARNLVDRLRIIGYRMSFSKKLQPLSKYIENELNIWFIRNHFLLEKIRSQHQMNGNISEVDYLTKRIEAVNSFKEET